MADTLEFNDIYQEVKGSWVSGTTEFEHDIQGVQYIYIYILIFLIYIYNYILKAQHMLLTFIYLFTY